MTDSATFTPAEAGEEQLSDLLLEVLQQTEMISEEWPREDLGQKNQAVADALSRHP